MPVQEELEESDLRLEVERMDRRETPAGYRSDETEESDDREDIDRWDWAEVRPVGGFWEDILERCE